MSHKLILITMKSFGHVTILARWYFGVKSDVWVLVLPISTCMNFNKLLHCSVAYFPIVQNRNKNSTYLIVLLCELNHLTHVKGLIHGRMWKQGRHICYYYHITVTIFFFYFKVVSCLLKMFQARQKNRIRYLFNVFSILVLRICC